MNATKPADLILHNGRITTLDSNHREAKDLAVQDGRSVGVDEAEGSSWFSSESGKKGAIAVGQLADFVALTEDYF